MKGQVTQQTIDAAFREGYEACLNKRAGEVKKIEQLHQQVALLRAEVKAWRTWHNAEPEISIDEPLLYQAAINAAAATDAAGALEDK